MYIYIYMTSYALHATCHRLHNTCYSTKGEVPNEEFTRRGKNKKKPVVSKEQNINI